MDRVYLNIGCGRQPLAGFVNIDLEPRSEEHTSELQSH